MGADVNELLRKAYEGEVLGEAFFARLAETSPDGEQRAKLDALRRLEASTKELLRPVLEHYGVSTDEKACRNTGTALADAAGAMPWRDLLDNVCGDDTRAVVTENRFHTAGKLILNQ